MIVHIITHLRKIHHNFLSLFRYVSIFNNKLIIRVQNYMKNNDKKIITNFFNMHCDVHYYPAKFEIKIQLIYRETKKINCI